METINQGQQTDHDGEGNPPLGKVKEEDKALAQLLRKIDNGEDIDQVSMNKLYEETLKNFEEGEVIKGTVVSVVDGDVLVDVGYKSEGLISLSEFKDADGNQTPVNIGDQVDVYLEKMEDADGLVVLSREKANKIKVWEQINEAYEKNEVVEGVVTKKIKGGLTVDVGIPAFLPGSQVDLRPVRDLDSLIGKTLPLKVIKLNIKRGNIVLSRRAILEEERKAKREEIIKTIEEGKIVKGIVKNITEYGAFVDLGGLDGLLHVTDMSWGRIRHPSEMFVVGDQVEVVILKFDRDNERISLGLKQKTPDPWDLAAEKYPVGSRVRGKVVSLVDYGSFLELEEGVEGLIHVSEMSWNRRVRHPSKLLAIGDVVDVVVLELDCEKRRISLGMKQTEPNPWQVIKEKYKIGDHVKGKVRNLTDFGAFVELNEGVDGLIHISDLSWTRRVKHPSEMLKKNEEIEAVILNINVEQEKLSLGIKQLTPDPWEGIEEKYPIGSNFKGKVSLIAGFGAIVKVEEGVEGLIPSNELANLAKSSPKKEALKVGDEVFVKIVRLDSQSRKLGLSISAYHEEEEREEIKSYLDKQNEETLENKLPLGKTMEQFSAQNEGKAEDSTSEEKKSAESEETASQDENQPDNEESENSAEEKSEQNTPE
jgi:small subunit ribosomal protein S1